MKKIINGKAYNTATAKCVGGWCDMIRGHSYCSEELYRKRTGEFFIHGEGGAKSKYAISCGDNNWSGGEKIIPLTYTAAQHWAEEHLSGDEYEAIFGEAVEKGGKSNITVHLKNTLIERVKRAAQKDGKSLSAYVEALLDSGTP